MGVEDTGGRLVCRFKLVSIRDEGIGSAKQGPTLEMIIKIRDVVLAMIIFSDCTGENISQCVTKLFLSYQCPM